MSNISYKEDGTPVFDARPLFTMIDAMNNIIKFFKEAKDLTNQQLSDEVKIINEKENKTDEDTVKAACYAWMFYINLDKFLRDTYHE